MNRFSVKLLLFLGTFLYSVFSGTMAIAQISNDFQIANRFMQQQKYESALPLFEKLVRENPNEFFFLERYMECFIQLKQYDEALKTLQGLPTSQNYLAQINVLEAQLYHFKGDTSKAYEIWETTIEQNPRNLQLYISTSNAMSDMNEFRKAVGVLREARIQFNNPQLFYNDISTTLLQASDYEGAVQEWISWLTSQPDQISNIQRMLLRYNDPFLNDITILELEDKLEELSVTNQAYNTLFRFQVWLLQENKLYRRALASATAFERSTSNFNYSLFQLGRSLRNNNEFELAIQAFEYYIEIAQGNLQWQSREELAKVYNEWAKQIDDFNLGNYSQKDSLFSLALEQLNLIISEGSSYRNIQRVLVMKSEIVLDHNHDLDAAKQVLSQLNTFTPDQDTPEEFYLDGRIKLAERDFVQSRISLTKSNKLAGIGELAEKTRYFLALNDFYNRDYEFAKIQLKSLGRQNTSYYANDALELRLWIQEGVNADTTGETLKPFADAIFDFQTGNKKESGEKLLTYIDNSTSTPLYDNAILLIAKNPTVKDSVILNLTENFIASNNFTSKKDQLMWQRAKFALQIYQKNVNEQETELPDISKSQVERYFEELILEFPQGFYAPYARKYLKDITENNI